MNLLGRHGTIGRAAPVAVDPDEVRQARISYARSNPHWAEIDEPRLCSRGPGWLVDAETDLVWTVRRGVVFEQGSARPGYLDPQQPATFFVDRHRDVRFLEVLTTPATWSAYVERRERQRAARTRAPL